MRRILVVDDDLHVGQAISVWPKEHGFRVSSADGATRCLRKPFKPTTLLGVMDECLSAAEPHRRQVAALGAVADSLSEQQAKPAASNLAMAAPRDPGRFGERLS
jgi:hypothetical protein